MRTALTLLTAATLLTPASWAQSPIEPGTTVAGEIAAALETKSYTLRAEMGDSIVIRAVATGGMLWPRARLLTPYGFPLIEGTGSTTVDLQQSIIQSGVYTITVSDGLSGSNTGSFALYAQIANRPGRAAVLTPGTPVSAQAVSPAGFLSYTIDTLKGDTIVARAANASGDLWPLIRLYDPYGTLIEKASGSAIADMTRTVSAEGTHTILVGDGFNGTRSGEFGLFAQRSNRPGTVEVIDPGATVSGAVGSQGAFKTYTISAEAGEAIVARASTTTGNLWPLLRLYDPNGVFIAEGSASLTVDFATTAASPGTYTLLVGDGYNGTYTGQYNLFVQKPAHPSNATDLSQAPVHTGAITSPGSMKTYVLTTPPSGPGTLELILTKTGGSLWPLLRLYDGYGNLVKETTGTSNAVISSVVQPSRLYTVLTGSGHNGTLTGQYTLKWNSSVPDLVRALQLAGGFSKATPDDVSKLNKVTTGTPHDQVNIADAVAIARQAWGL